MAIRVTQELLEIFGDQSTSNVRVTQLLAEIFGSQSTSNARCTQILVEVFGPVWPDVSDNLNSWLDTTSTELGAGVLDLPISTGDTLSFSDAIDSYVDVWYIILPEDSFSLSDSDSSFLAINLTVDETSSLNNWAETLWIGSSELIFKDPSDSLDYWLDTVETFNALELGQEISDGLTLSDTVSLRLSLRWLPTDSLNNWSDSLVISFSIPLLVSDTLNNWNSIVTSILGSAPGIFESLTLAESYRLILSHLLSSLDSLLLSDSLVLKKGDFTEFSDLLTLSDAVATSLFVNEFVSVGDSLNNWDDGDYQYASLAEDDYYRRYLNDRAFRLGERKTFYCDSLTMSDSVSVERH